MGGRIPAQVEEATLKREGIRRDAISVRSPVKEAEPLLPNGHTSSNWQVDMWGMERTLMQVMRA